MIGGADGEAGHGGQHNGCLGERNAGKNPLDVPVQHGVCRTAQHGGHAEYHQDFAPFLAADQQGGGDREQIGQTCPGQHGAEQHSVGSVGIRHGAQEHMKHGKGGHEGTACRNQRSGQVDGLGIGIGGKGIDRRIGQGAQPFFQQENAGKGQTGAGKQHHQIGRFPAGGFAAHDGIGKNQCQRGEKKQGKKVIFKL